MNKKRVLIVCQHFWPESFRINDIADFLVEKDCEVEVLCGRPNYPTGKFFSGYTFWNKSKELHNGVEIHRALEIPRGNNSNVRILVNYVSFPFFSLFHIPRLLTKHYDYILLYQLSPVMMSISGIIVGKIKKIPTTMYVLDLWPENLFSVLPIKNKLLNRLVTVHSHWYYKKADRLVALSERMKQRLLEVSGKSEENVIVLPQACEKLYEKNIEDKAIINRYKKTFNVVFTGNISPAQSFGTMIEAAEILKHEGLTDIHWLIVGDGMSRKQVEKDIASRNLSELFTFEGQKPVEDMPKYTNIADVLVGCLVKSELLEATIPAKVMSYIAAGRPIVLAMDGEVQILINNEIRCGFAGDTSNAQLLAQNIKRVYNLNKEQRRAMGVRARKYHFANFERNLILGKLYDAIVN